MTAAYGCGCKVLPRSVLALFGTGSNAWPDCIASIHVVMIKVNAVSTEVFVCLAVEGAQEVYAFAKGR